MKRHNSAHLIRFLGPTGTAAKQIGGMTIHKGLGLSIALKPNGRGNRKATEPGPDPGPVFYGSGLGKMISAISGIRLGWVWMGMGSGNYRQVR